MFYVLWEYGEYEWHAVGVYHTVQQAYEARGPRWKISSECFGKLNSNVRWVSYNDRDERQHLAVTNVLGANSYSFVGLERALKLLAK